MRVSSDRQRAFTNFVVHIILLAFLVPFIIASASRQLANGEMVLGAVGLVGALSLVVIFALSIFQRDRSAPKHILRNLQLSNAGMLFVWYAIQVVS